METLLNDISMRVIVVLIATPIVMIISGLTKKFWQQANGPPQSAEAPQDGSGGSSARGPAAGAIPWNSLAYAVVYGAVMVGIMELSLAMTERLFGIDDEAQWTLGSSVVVWGIYLVLSTLGGILAQGLISASRQSGQGLVERSATLRGRQMLGGGLWTKLAFLPVYLGWAALAAPGTVFRPMIFALLTFVIIDVLSVLAMLTREQG